MKNPEGERLFKHLADSLPQMVWVTDAEGNVEYTNRRWYEYTGLTPDTFSKASWRVVTHPDDIARVLEAQSEALKNNSEFLVEYRVRRHDGEYRWHLARTVFVPDTSGQLLKRFGTATDIHVQKLSEEKQRFFGRTSETLAGTLEFQGRLNQATRLAIEYFGGVCVIFLQKPEGGISIESVANAGPNPADSEAALKLQFPYRAEDLMGPAAVIRTGQAQMLTNNSHSEMMIPLKTNRGIFGAITFINSDRAYTAMDLEDAQEFARRISWTIDNARLYHELLAEVAGQKENQKKLEKAVSARDEFLSIASHELKTPLTSLKLQIQMRERLLDRGSLEAFAPPRLKKMIAVDSRQIDRLVRLVDDMLDISRVNTGKLSIQSEEFDLVEMINDVADRISDSLLAAGCTLSIEALEPVIGSWDRFRLEQVYINLLTNAMRYGPGKPIRVQVVREGEQVSIWVHDQGGGIAPENHDRIFGRFERAVSSHEVSGLGLGLYITREIVEAHGGTIQVKSNLGQGAAFGVSLPMHPVLKG